MFEGHYSKENSKAPRWEHVCHVGKNSKAVNVARMNSEEER